MAWGSYETYEEAAEEAAARQKWYGIPVRVVKLVNGRWGTQADTIKSPHVFNKVYILSYSSYK